MASNDFLRGIILTTSAYDWGKRTQILDALEKYRVGLSNLVKTTRDHICLTAQNEQLPGPCILDTGEPLIGDVYRLVRVGVGRLYGEVKPRGDPNEDDWNDVLAWLAIEKFLPEIQGNRVND